MGRLIWVAQESTKCDLIFESTEKGTYKFSHSVGEISIGRYSDVDMSTSLLIFFFVHLFLLVIK